MMTGPNCNTLGIQKLGQVMRMYFGVNKRYGPAAIVSIVRSEDIDKIKLLEFFKCIFG